MRLSRQVRLVKYLGATVSLVVMGVILQPQARGLEVLVAGVFLLLALVLLEN